MLTPRIDTAPAESKLKGFINDVGGKVIGAFALAEVFKTGFEAQNDYQKGLAQLQAGLKSTGDTAGLTAGDMEELASKVSDYSGQNRNTIVSTEQLLLAFHNVRDEAGKGNDVFTRTTQIAADMAARLGGDASSQAIKLGKALEDPIHGTSTLTRVGVQFTEGQKALIKSLVDSGDSLGAQKVILDQLDAKFAGSAKAVGDTLPGQINKAKNSFEELAGSVVGVAAPALEAFLKDANLVLGVVAKHPVVLKLATEGLELFGAAWLALKVGGWATSLAEAASAFFGVGTAATIAAGEVAAADSRVAAAGVATAGAGAAGAGAAEGVAAAGAGAGAAAAEGAAAAGVSKLALLRVAVPIAVTYEVVNKAGLKKSFEDILSGQFGKVENDSPTWEKIGINDLFGPKLSGELVSPEVFKQLTANLNLSKNSVEGWFQTFRDVGSIQKFQDTLKHGSAALDSNTDSLLGNSIGATSNRNALKSLATQAITASQAYERTTGRAGDFTKALELSIPQILNQASATGLNRQQTADYLNTLIKIPGFKVTKVGLDGTAAAEAELSAFLNALNQIAQPIRIPIETFLASPTAANQLAGSAFGVNTSPNADGGISLHGRPGGMVQWAEAGGEAFIPLAPAKHARSLDLWAQTGKLLGVHGFADGGIAPPAWTTASYTAPGRPENDSMPALLAAVERLEHAIATAPREMLHIDTWKGDQVDADGLASQLAFKTRASVMARRV